MSYKAKQSNIEMYDGSIYCNKIKIVKIEHTNTSTNQNVDLTPYNFQSIISISIQSESTNQIVFGIVKSYTSANLNYTVAKSKTTGVLIGGSVDGLELTSGILNHITIIGT